MQLLKGLFNISIQAGLFTGLVMSIDRTDWRYTFFFSLLLIIWTLTLKDLREQNERNRFIKELQEGDQSEQD
jgi:hypothetical protein